jgi:hypothetical protein
VGAIDGRSFQVGAGTVTARLSAEFSAFTREYAAAHPELKV